MMKSFFKKLAFVMALAMVVSLAAPAAAKAVAANELKIAYQNGSAITELNIAKVGNVEDLKFLGAKTWENVVWTSSDETVATVNNKGEVTAVAAGTADITVTVDGLTATVKVYCVNPSENKATIGSQDGTQRSMSTYTMKVDEEFDFAFFGIKDYDAKRYDCTWLSLTPDVAEVDKSGNVTAKAAGTAAITLSVTNQVIGKTYVVAPVVITVVGEEPVATATPVPTATPIPEVEIVAAQKTEKSFELTFENANVDLEKLAKNEIEVYEQHIDETTGVEHLYIWQINTITLVKDKENTVLVTGYATDELVDGQKYIVKYVVPNADEEKVEVVEETSFVASVGAVVRVESSYKSYYNNQKTWTFSNIAYTSENYGEDIPVRVDYELYDAKGINVTGHYLRLNDNKNLVSLELVTEEAEDCFTIDEDTNTLVFDEIPNSSYVVFDVVYEDEKGEEVIDELKMLVKKAPAYHVTSIDHWAINIIDDETADNDPDKKVPAYADTFSKLKDWVALYDDYNVNTMEPMENHEIVLWFTDNYGNAYVTNGLFSYGFDTEYTKYNGMKHYSIETSEKFNNEGFELYYETKSPQTLVVGDEYDELTTSNIITTKKTGTATVNVTLHNEDGLVDRIDSLKIVVKAARYLKSFKTNTSILNLTSDSIATGVEEATDAADRIGTDNRAGDRNEYDKYWTGGKIVLTATDNHGAPFGAYNDTLLDNFSLGIVSDYAALAQTIRNRTDLKYNAEKGTFEFKLYGPEIANIIADPKVTKAEVELTAIDGSNDKEVEEDFKVVLREVNYKDDNSGDILVEKTELRANGTYGYVNTKDLVIPIHVVEISNKLDVNFSDKVEFVPSVPQNITAASAGAMFLTVTDPKGNALTENGDFYIDEVEPGRYNFCYAKHNNGGKGTRFAIPGTYVVKLVTVTDKGTLTTKTEKFKLVDDRLEFSYKDQDFIHVSDDLLDEFETVYYSYSNGDTDIEEIAADAFSYVYKGTNKEVSFGGVDGYNNPVAEVSGVRYNVNKNANAVVIKDVFFKVWIDFNADGDWKDGDDKTYYYHVEVEIPDGKTISLETLNDSIGASVPYRLDPDNETIQ